MSKKKEMEKKKNALPGSLAGLRLYYTASFPIQPRPTFLGNGATHSGLDSYASIRQLRQSFILDMFTGPI